MTDEHGWLIPFEGAIGKLTNLRGGNARDVQRYTWTLRWKLESMDHHCTLLENMNWDGFGGATATAPLQVDCRQTSGVAISLHSTRACELTVLMSVDGIAAACVNAVDTLARLLNEAYRIDVAAGPGGTTTVCPTNMDRLVKLVENRKQSTPLGSVISQFRSTSWLGAIRKMRGECQHGQITRVVITPIHNFGMPDPEPVIADEFCPDFIVHTRVSQFSKDIRTRTTDLLKNAAAVVIELEDRAIVGG